MVGSASSGGHGGVEWVPLQVPSMVPGIGLGDGGLNPTEAGASKAFHHCTLTLADGLVMAVRLNEGGGKSQLIQLGMESRAIFDVDVEFHGLFAVPMLGVASL